MKSRTAAPATAVTSEPTSPPPAEMRATRTGTANDGADDTDHDVTEQAEAAAAHQLAREPAATAPMARKIRRLVMSMMIACLGVSGPGAPGSWSTSFLHVYD